MRQARDVPRDRLVESTGRCSDQRRSREVKLFHYERTRVVFIHSLLLLSRAGFRGNGDGYLTLEAEVWLQTILCCSQYWWRYGNCYLYTHWEHERNEKVQRKFARESDKGKNREQGVLTIHTAKTHCNPRWTAITQTTELYRGLNNLTWSDLSAEACFVSNYIKAPQMPHSIHKMILFFMLCMHVLWPWTPVARQKRTGRLAKKPRR